MDMAGVGVAGAGSRPLIQRQTSTGRMGDDPFRRLQFCDVRLHSTLDVAPTTLPDDAVDDAAPFSYDFARFRAFLNEYEEQQSTLQETERTQKTEEEQAERDVREAEEAEAVAKKMEEDEQARRKAEAEEAARNAEQVARQAEFDRRKEANARAAALAGGEQTAEVVKQRLQNMGFTDAQCVEALKRHNTVEACSEWILTNAC